MNPTFEYWYRAKITSVYDGDTVTADIDLGFGLISKNNKIRLYGIDTPELRGSERTEGLKVRDYVRVLLANTDDITINTFKDKSGKYGRYLARIWVDGVCINDHLLEKGMAKPYGE